MAVYIRSQPILVKHINCHVQRENSIVFFWIFEFHKVVYIVATYYREVEIFVYVGPYVANFHTNHLVK